MSWDEPRAPREIGTRQRESTSKRKAGRVKHGPRVESSVHTPCQKVSSTLHSLYISVSLVSHRGSSHEGRGGNTAHRKTPPRRTRQANRQRRRRTYPLGVFEKVPCLCVYRVLQNQALTLLLHHLSLSLSFSTFFATKKSGKTPLETLIEVGGGFFSCPSASPPLLFFVEPKAMSRVLVFWVRREREIHSSERNGGGTDRGGLYKKY